MTSNMSLQLNADFCEPLHGFAAALAEELHAHAVPVTAAVRSFYKDIVRLDFETVEGVCLNLVRGNIPAASPVPAGALSNPPMPSDSDTFFADDCPPPTHWGINE